MLFLGILCKWNPCSSGKTIFCNTVVSAKVKLFEGPSTVSVASFGLQWMLPCALSGWLNNSVFEMVELYSNGQHMYRI